ncbi:hypothetical protein [Staphylococcus xylosus]|uniref:hypothetical protein n=1 Tax=Staphylococcus xylosus TaxID=1288 RepID=UPI002DB8A907|nr:hypothetical protein [Staphylococcus xylosus]MEB8101605.1 hypothetical protein [Staphylococcus xylosus]
MAYEWVEWASPALSFFGGVVGSVVTLRIGLKNFKLNEQSLKQQRVINQMNLRNAKKINDQSLKAEVVVKSRMEWIKDVRDMSRRFITLHAKQLSNINHLISYSNNLDKYQTMAFAETYNTESENIVQLITNLDKELNDNYIEFSKIHFEFFNYFPTVNVDDTENTDNLEIINTLEACLKSIDDLKEKWQQEIQKSHLNKDKKDYLSGVNEIGKDFRKDISETDKDIEIFSNEITKYLKKEWEKVKRIE